jgi:transcriptional regulator with XRE-family HTH domain
MSQRELAKASKMSPATVARLEVGQLDPRGGQLQRLLDQVCWSLVVVDIEGRFVVPLEEFQGDLRDGAERRFPAHLDTILDPTWGERWGDSFGLARPPETFPRDRVLRDQRRAASQRDLYRGPYRRRRRR